MMILYSLLFLDHSISLAIFILELFHSQAIRRWFHIKFDNTLYTVHNEVDGYTVEI